MNSTDLARHFQFIFNTLQNFKGVTKIIDLRPQFEFEQGNIPDSVNIDPRQPITALSLKQKLLGPNTSLRRLRRYFIILASSSQYQEEASSTQSILRSVKCRDFLTTFHYPHFLQQYSFLKSSGLLIEYPNEVIFSSLYLGSLKHAENRRVLQDLKITHIVNVTNTIPNYFHNDGITYLKLPLNDTASQNIQFYFRKAFEFLEKALQDPGNRVLVHCAQGVSRSVTIVAMYVMKVEELTAEKALKKMQKYRNASDPNQGFRLKLEQFQKSRKLFARSRSCSLFEDEQLDK